MSLAFDLKTYEADIAQSPNSMRYLGPDHAILARDIVDLKRSVGQIDTIHEGKATRMRVIVKLVRSLEKSAYGSVVNIGDVICELNVSYPQGIEAADITALQTEMLAGWCNSSSFQDLVLKQDIVQ